MNIRRVDNLGRIVIPKEMREELNLKDRVPGNKDGSPVLMKCKDGVITLQRAFDGCRFCGRETDNTYEIDGIKICHECAEKIYSKLVKDSI